MSQTRTRYLKSVFFAPDFKQKQNAVYCKEYWYDDKDITCELSFQPVDGKPWIYEYYWEGLKICDIDVKTNEVLNPISGLVVYYVECAMGDDYDAYAHEMIKSKEAYLQRKKLVKESVL